MVGCQGASVLLKLSKTLKKIGKELISGQQNKCLIYQDMAKVRMGPGNYQQQRMRRWDVANNGNLQNH